MGESQFTKPMKFNEWWAIRSQALQELRLTPEEWFRLFAGQNIDSGGTPQLMLNTSGQVTEANSTNINTSTQGTYYQTWAAGPLTAGWTSPGSLTAASYMHHLVYVVPITIAAGGAVTNVALHATLAGYKFHFKVLGIMLDTTDATTTWWFHTTAGAASVTGCPATPGFSPVNLTATTVNTQLAGAFMANQAATGDITLLDVAGVGAGAANGFIYIEGWFETT